MTQVTLRDRDKETGLFKTETIYNLNDLGQAIVFAFQNHESRIQHNENSIQDLQEKLKRLEDNEIKRTKDFEVLINEIKRLQQENSKLKNGDVPKKFDF